MRKVYFGDDCLKWTSGREVEQGGREEKRDTFYAVVCNLFPRPHSRPLPPGIVAGREREREGDVRVVPDENKIRSRTAIKADKNSMACLLVRYHQSFTAESIYHTAVSSPTISRPCVCSLKTSTITNVLMVSR